MTFESTTQRRSLLIICKVTHVDHTFAPRDYATDAAASRVSDRRNATEAALRPLLEHCKALRKCDYDERNELIGEAVSNSCNVKLILRFHYRSELVVNSVCARGGATMLRE